MILQLLVENPALGAVFLLAIALAISVHEAAHAWTALKLGDPTAASLGRTSLNPLVHLDPIGTLMLLIAGFGWGKPVPVDDARLKRKTDVILVALAGPVSNFCFALVLALVFRLLPIPMIQEVISLFIVLNLALMIFNLIPVPPLDGSKVLKLFLSPQTYAWLEHYGLIMIIVLFVVVRFGAFGLSDGLSFGVRFLFGLLTGASSSLF